MPLKCPGCHFDNPADTFYCGKCATKLDVPEQEARPSKLNPDLMGQISFTKTLETTADELTRGTLFSGRYEIIEELGAGGMGKVYRAQDIKLNEEVALKLIRPEFGADKRTVERFHNEIKLARKIRHKNVCVTHDLHEEGRTLYLTMEYVRGEDLKSFIRRSKVLSVGTAVSIARQVAEGLAEAHKLGIVHRDLKPGNVMIDKEGQAKIMDFGIARAMHEKGITGAGAIVGTPEYMSPEQVEGKEADQRADIYALGVILFEMVTGQTPFEGETPLSIAHKHRYEPPPDPRTLNPQIPIALSRVILRCMEKPLEKRYQTTGEFMADIEAIEASLPTTERAAGRTPSRTRPRTSREITVKFRPRRLLIPAAAVLALAGALILWHPWSRRTVAPAPPGKPSLAILQFDNTSGDKGLDSWKIGLSDLLIEGLSQSKFINVLSVDRIYSLLKKLDLLEATRYSTEDLRRVARESGVNHTVSGGLLKAGDRIIITLTVQKPQTGEIIRTSRVECNSEEDIIVKADELIRQIKVDLTLTPDQIAQDGDREVARITTGSSQAFKYYSEGRRLQHRTDYRGSIALMEKAVALDPEFALAYRSMGAAYGNLGDNYKSSLNLEKAFQWSARATEKERLWIQGSYYGQKERDLGKALESFEKLAVLYPDVAAAQLGIICSGLEDWQTTIKYMDVRRHLDNPWVFYTSATAYMGLGSYDKARETCHSYLDNFSKDNPLILRALWGSYISEGLYEDALREDDKLEKGSSERDWVSLILKGEWSKAETLCRDASSWSFDQESLACVRLSEGRFNEAIKELRNVATLAEKPANQENESDFHAYLAHAYLKTGRYEEALEECQRAIDLAREAGNCSLQIYALDLRGTAQVGMGSESEAGKTAEELKVLVDGFLNKKLMRHYFHLLGMIELKNGNAKQAIESLERSVSLLSGQIFGSVIREFGRAQNFHAYFIDSLAAAYYQSRDLDKARETYSAITKLGSGRLRHGDIYAKAFYMLGKIAEQQGDKVRAREKYTKFLDLWKDADPGLPEVEDAKKRLALL